jgi:predicted nucleic acid-binding protein
VVLVDSSVWITYLQSGVQRLTQLLEDQQVLVHEMVMGEVVMGSEQQRALAFELLPFLPMTQSASHLEVMELVDKQRLHGRGVGYIDVHLLTAVVLQPGARLWTLDKRLYAAADRLGIAFTDLLH